MSRKPLLYETHMHTPLCRHAVGEPEEYAAAARRRGLAGITVTCHNPMPDDYGRSVRMSPEEFPDYLALVERARSALEGEVEVLLGIECDYFPGYEKFLEEQIASAPFEYVLGSVHPHLREYQEAYFTGDVPAFQKTYFDHLAEAAETGLFDCLSHPDIVKNSFPEAWDVRLLLDPIRRALDRIARAGTAMELNTSGIDKTIPEFNPGSAILEEMRQRGIPVVVGADAHVPRRVGADFEDALDALSAAGYREVSLFLDRDRREIPIDAARTSLRKLGTVT
ncbi:MAG: histidinol-phosphatase [Planctomycetota bacterium]|nr:histidinol-phosphatase [Planctomycetota bacterium]